MARSGASKTGISSNRHKASRLNIPAEELRDFVAEEEKRPRACERAGVRASESATVRA